MIAGSRDRGAVFDSPIEAPTSERQFLRLSDEWALSADSNQWILQRFRGIRKSGPHAGQEVWESLSFVGSNKAVLIRILHEKGVVVAPEASAALHTMPERFLDFIANRSVRLTTPCKAKTS